MRIRDIPLPPLMNILRRRLVCLERIRGPGGGVDLPIRLILVLIWREVRRVIVCLDRTTLERQSTILYIKQNKQFRMNFISMNTLFLNYSRTAHGSSLFVGQSTGWNSPHQIGGGLDILCKSTTIAVCTSLYETSDVVT